MQMPGGTVIAREKETRQGGEVTSMTGFVVSSSACRVASPYVVRPAGLMMNALPALGGRLGTEVVQFW